MKKYIIIAILSLIISPLAYGQNLKLLKPLYIVDVERGMLVKDQNILILDNKIIAMGSLEKIRQDSRFLDKNIETIELKGMTLLPGLIDAHSHILLHPYNETSWNDQVLKESRGERVARGVNHLKATLAAGFTSLRDLGSEGAGYADVDLRNVLNKGVIEGPRLIVAGRAIVATGSYGPKGYDLSHDIILGAEAADGQDLIRVVRDQIGKGADVIKVYADYRWGPNGEARPTFSLDEFKTIVETAVSSGRPVVAHAATDEGMRRAIMAGVQSIEHGDAGTVETFNLMKRRGVIYCPTIAVTEAMAEYGGWQKGKNDAPNGVVKKHDAVTSALKAGVIFCNGSDVGPYTHGDNLRELKLMHEYGLSIKKTLQAATMVGAELMGQGHNLGQVKVGYLADLIAVTGNPLTDLNILQKIDFIMKDGDVYHPSH